MTWKHGNMEKSKKKEVKKIWKERKKKRRLRRREAVGTYAQTLKNRTHLFIFLSVNINLIYYLLYLCVI